MSQFVVSFQSQNSEHRVVCNESEVEEQVEFHKKRGHIISVVPREIVENEEFC